MNALKLASLDRAFELSGCMAIMVGYIVSAAVLVSQFLQ